MGKVVRREYIKIPKDYWTSSINVEYIIRKENAKKTT